MKKKGLPQFGEIVLCTAHRITPNAAWCKLDEYEDVEGMIHISEAAGKWVYNIKDFIKPNKQYVARVIRIDRDRGIINLSIKKASKADKKQKMNAYRHEQRGEKILEQAAKSVGKSFEQAFEEIGQKLISEFGDLWTAIQEAKEDKTVLNILPKNWSDALSDAIGKSFKDKEIVLKVNLEIKSYEGDGVKKIKNIFSSLEKSGLKVSYISAPNYRVELKTKDPKTDEKKMRGILDKAVETIEENGEGSYEFVKG